MKYSSIAAKEDSNVFQSKCMLQMTTMIRLGKSLSPPLDEDCCARIMTCIRVLAYYPAHNELQSAFTTEPRKAFAHLVTLKEAAKNLSKPNTSKPVQDLISFRLLKPKKQIVDAVFHSLRSTTQIC
jgi:hypothetical protein